MRAIKRTRINEEKMEVEIPESKPRVEFLGQDIPEIKDWNVGKEYVLKVKVKMVSKREGNEWNDKDTETRASFKVTAVGVEKPKKEAGRTVSNEEYADMMQKARN